MEKLYNGILLPDVWPPRDIPYGGRQPLPVPYLDKENKPEAIDITVGRQLFVDDFLIAETTLETVYHNPTLHTTPVVYPDKPWEGKKVRAVSGGVWYEEEERLFKMWYSTGHFHRLCYAVSKDGVHWEKPDLGEGNNIAVHDRQPDYNTVWIDRDDPDPKKRYKMFFRMPDREYRDGNDCNNHCAYIYYSEDGMHFQQVAQTDGLGDASTMFYNAFRKKWVYSMRITELDPQTGRAGGIGRHRCYRECDDLVEGARWENDPDAKVFWQRADCLDPSDPRYQNDAELYDVNCNAYESIMLGSFMILEGPSNFANSYGCPKTTEIFLGFSRDGFHFSRPSREPFIPCTGRMGDMNQGYIHLAGGVCVIVGEELWFYYSAYCSHSGLPGTGYDNAAISLARLRRDGFASLTGCGEIVTEVLTVSGDKRFLFINASGTVRAEVLDSEGKVVPGYSFDACEPFNADATMARLTWQSGKDLSFLNDSRFRLRFAVEGSLYAFWLSGDLEGTSNGFLAAGYKPR